VAVKSSEMQFGVIYHETWAGTQSHTAIWTFELHSCFFVVSGTHVAPNSLPLQGPVYVVSVFYVKSHQLVHGWNVFPGM